LHKNRFDLKINGGGGRPIREIGEVIFADGRRQLVAPKFDEGGCPSRGIPIFSMARNPSTGFQPQRRGDAEKNPEGISSFSPALPDAIGLRWVANQNDLNPKRVESLRAKR
jgi:hypothetical protein